jgi:hypothetical protein
MMKWMDHVACMEKMKIAYRILFKIFEGVKLLHLVQDRDGLHVFVNNVMSLLVL